MIESIPCEEAVPAQSSEVWMTNECPHHKEVDSFLHGLPGQCWRKFLGGSTMHESEGHMISPTTKRKIVHVHPK